MGGGKKKSEKIRFPPHYGGKFFTIPQFAWGGRKNQLPPHYEGGVFHPPPVRMGGEKKAASPPEAENFDTFE